MEVGSFLGLKKFHPILHRLFFSQRLKESPLLFYSVAPSFPIHYPASTAYVTAAWSSLNSNLCLLSSVSAGLYLDPHFFYCCLKTASNQKTRAIKGLALFVSFLSGIIILHYLFSSF